MAKTAKTNMITAYDLPFEVRYSSQRMFSSDQSVDLICTLFSRPISAGNTISQIVELFEALGRTGALAGESIQPWKSELNIEQLTNGSGLLRKFRCIESQIDDNALIVLAHLLMARQEEIFLRSLEICVAGEIAKIRLHCDPNVLSTYPKTYGSLPFSLSDSEPESGAYTLTGELIEPLKPENAEELDKALRVWTRAVLAGGYGLAPIPPLESYVEPDDQYVTFFGSTIEWTIFKLRADPACLCGLINIFAAFHQRCQRLVSLTIS